MSMYNPSLLLTATLCDPDWNAEKKKLFESKLKSREVVDWEARALEQDRDAIVGLLPVKPDEEMISIRYYQGITDAEFDAFLEE